MKDLSAPHSNADLLFVKNREESYYSEHHELLKKQEMTDKHSRPNNKVLMTESDQEFIKEVKRLGNKTFQNKRQLKITI